MREKAICMNGIFNKVFTGILAAQSQHPNKTFYLQPYRKEYIAHLRDNIPSIADPVTLYASVAQGDESIPQGHEKIYYTAEIVDWKDTEKLSREEHERLKGTLALQDELGGLYSPRNLIGIRNLRYYKQPFLKSELRKYSDNEPLSVNTFRGHVYVKPLLSEPAIAD